MQNTLSQKIFVENAKNKNKIKLRNFINQKEEQILGHTKRTLCFSPNLQGLTEMHMNQITEILLEVISILLTRRFVMFIREGQEWLK